MPGESFPAGLFYVEGCALEAERGANGSEGDTCPGPSAKTCVVSAKGGLAVGNTKERCSKERLSARVWPGIHEGLVPETDRRLSEIMDWVADNGEDWIFEFLKARSKAIQENDPDALVGQILPEDFLTVRFDLTSAQAKVLCAFLAGQTLQ